MTPADLSNLFPDSAPIDRAATAVESRMQWPAVPAKYAVYLLTGPAPTGDEAEHPFLLATVGNLRAALQRRLTDDPPELRTKRIQYGQSCTRLHWRIVHSPFAANWWYARAARLLFPEACQKMIAWRPAWWLAVEKNAPFPEFRRTQSLDDPACDYVGPIRDKSSAGKLIETIEDLFDLCRYHHILVQAPHGKACAYKEMGKCPAPCDGSVPLSWYHGQMRLALQFLAGESRASWQTATLTAMKSAADKLDFEAAARIKQRLTRAACLASEPFAHLASLADSAYLALQPGQGKPYLEPWIIHPGLPNPVEGLPQFKKKDLPSAAESLFTRCRQIARTPVAPPIAAAAIEDLALLAHHLFKGPDDAGIYLRLRDITSPEVILDAATRLFARKSPPKPPPEHASDKLPAEPPPSDPSTI